MLKPPITILLILIFTFLSLPVAAEDISISQSLDKTETAFEDSVVMTITLTWAGDQTAYYFPKPLQPIIDKLKVRQFSSSISSTGQGENEKTTKKYIYTLIPTVSGMGRIESISIDYLTWPDSTAGVLVTEPMSVMIQKPVPVAIDTGGINIYVLVVIIVLAAGIVGFVLFAIFKARSKKHEEPAKSPVDKLLDDLTYLKSEVGSDLKKFQTGLYKILITYLNDQYHLDLSGDSSEQIIDKLNKADIDSAHKGKISAWLMRAEREKFSPVEAPPGETMRLESEIREYFTRTNFENKQV